MGTKRERLSVTAELAVKKPKATLDTLIKCVNHGTARDLKKLLETNTIPVELNDNNGWTPIHHAAYKGRIGMLRLMLTGSDKDRKHLANLKAWQNETPLLVACSADKVRYDVVEHLLNNYADPNAFNLNKENSLHLLCKIKGNRTKIAKLLIDKGANPSIQDDKDGFTPIMNSIYEARDLKMVKLLVDYTDLTLKNSSFDTLTLALLCLPRAVVIIVPKFIPTTVHISIMVRDRQWDSFLIAAPFCKTHAAFIWPRMDLGEGLIFDINDRVTPLHYCLNDVSTFKSVLSVLPPSFLSFYEATAQKPNYIPACIAASSRIPEEVMEAYLKFHAKIGRHQQMPSGTLTKLSEMQANIVRKYFIVDEQYKPDTLKSACRVAVRKAIRSQHPDEWSAYCWLRDCLLPPSVKNYLLFEVN